MIGPCLCGDYDCPSCYPGYGDNHWPENVERPLRFASRDELLRLADEARDRYHDTVEEVRDAAEE